MPQPTIIVTNSACSVCGVLVGMLKNTVANDRDDIDPIRSIGMVLDRL
jgi:hypothetical protein